MKNKAAAEKIMHSYNARVAWGKGDEDEALIDAINLVFPYRTEEQKADLFARLKEDWKDYVGIGRKLFIATTITSWNHSIVHGGKAVTRGE